MKLIIAGPITLLLIIRSYRRRSLTIPGLVAATLTALIHALPDSSLPFTLLCTFFLLGTSATKVKHAEKAKLTLSSSGSSGGEGSRTHIQVLANSACASLLCLIEYFTRSPPPPSSLTILNPPQPTNCLPLPSLSTTTPSTLLSPSTSPYLPLLLLGITANYAATSADTLSSELGILSRSTPFLITNPLRRVPRGTNGGVTPAGILYGSLGAAAIALTTLLLLPLFCPSPASYSLGASLAGKILTTGTGAGADSHGTAASLNDPSPAKWTSKLTLFLAITLWGTLGSLLDSLLGALLQVSVVDRRTGKVVEGAGGVRVLTRRRGENSTETANETKTTRAGGSTSGAGSSAEATERKSKTSPGDGGDGGLQQGRLNGYSGRESRYVSSGYDLLDNNGINFLMAAVMTVGGMVGVGVLGGAGVLA